MMKLLLISLFGFTLQAQALECDGDYPVERLRYLTIEEQYIFMNSTEASELSETFIKMLPELYQERSGTHDMYDPWKRTPTAIAFPMTVEEMIEYRTCFLKYAIAKAYGAAPSEQRHGPQPAPEHSESDCDSKQVVSYFEIQQGAGTHRIRKFYCQKR